MADTPCAVPTSRQHENSPASTAIESSTKSAPPSRAQARSDRRSAIPSGPPLHKIYALPAPIRTFPLPTFYPSNPLSLFQLAFAWVSQLISPPPAEPAVIHQGFWSPETWSVHIKDPRSIRALWEQGFFGKGNYSRSEPNWLKREQARRGKHDGHVAEEWTNQRREERKMMKWDRARKEQEAIRRTKLEEAWIAPVGPLELLALPNSIRDQKPDRHNNDSPNGQSARVPAMNGRGVIGSVVRDAIPNGSPSPQSLAEAANGTGHPTVKADDLSILPKANGHISPPRTPTDATRPIDLESAPEAGGSGKRRKSVRFSAKVESTTFQLADPPSPRHRVQPNGDVAQGSSTVGNSPLSQMSDLAASPPHGEANITSDAAAAPGTEIVDREHLQLTVEEAFYLVFALGTLTVTDSKLDTPFTTSDLFTLFRRSSYLPARKADLQPDDPFLVQYAVYHHFRSLGWVTRPGIKFGVDWLLYHRGPVFSHAEFAIVVLPSYSDPWWTAEGRQAPRRSWHWLHTMNRVQSTALKTLVVVYVDIPPPTDETLGAAEILERYNVREFIVKRWLSNRNRD
ncbi:hypothetical protein GGS23DRAFT_587579 [Durotheca rogersii]|uniref:uncharacterized protein n=1 Tax=Durotheca rogersii TaxID=419775 RepID=UPI00221FE81B|nr:uncharacterized protein GGS23DRAFT_587579 [Durotheca rogersii]KAI5857467.1 hypothetical protein GGS23DRAFT_587579 [Durotheca rogersii]